MDQKIDELKSYIEKQFCSRDIKLQKICGNLFKRFWKQIELQFSNELKKRSINQILEIKIKTSRTNKKSKSWNSTEEDFASSLKEFQQKIMKPVTKV